MQMRKLLATITAYVLLLSLILNLCACNSSNGEDEFSFSVDPVRIQEYEEYVEPEDEEDNHIMMAQPVGSWTRDIATDPSYGVLRSIDMRETTKWNPQANPNYAGNPGVVYLLDGYYDVDGCTMMFKGNPYYFDLLVSENGKDYTLLLSVTAENADEYYDENFVCTLDGLGAKRVAYIRIMFKGAGKNNSFVNFHELSFTGTYIGVGPVSIPEEYDPNALPESLIASHKLIGTWKIDLANDTGYGPNKSYDSNPFSKWNPMTAVSYAGSPGIIYALKKATDIGKIQVMLGGGIHYFDVYVSQDGQSYSQIATINKNNANMGYKTDKDGAYICTLDGLKLTSVTHLKLIFTGRTNASQYVNLTEVIVSKEGSEGVDTSWMMISRLNTDIVSHQFLGEWVRNLEGDASYGPACSYDGISTTKWNPQTKTGYAGEPGIVYKLHRSSNVMKLCFEVTGSTHYFDVYVSTDGNEYTQIASISRFNEDQAYKAVNGNYICTLDGLNLTGIRYIKVMFTGRPNGSTYINFNEVTVHRNGDANADNAWMLPDLTAEELMILSHQVLGEWVRNVADDPSFGVARSYDGNVATKWNPQTKTGFAGEPGVVYQLNKQASLKKIAVTFGGGIHYFDVYTSADGTEYTKIASISKVNEEKAYTEEGGNYICTLDGLALSDVQNIKLVFTGRANNGTYLNVQEVVVSEEGTDGLDTSWMLPEETEEPEATEPEVTEPEATEPEVTEPEVTEPEDTREEVKATVTAGYLQGTYVSNGDITKAYDNDTTTKWNPQSGGYKSGEGVAFKLDGAYDLTKILLTFSANDMYFDLFVSAAGDEWTQIASVNAETVATYYKDGTGVCTVDGLENLSIQFVKLNFTGRANGSAWINFFEIEVYGKECAAEEPEVTEPEITEPEDTTEVKATIIAGELLGPWKIPSAINNAYDGNTSSQWNPQSIGYESGEAVVFHMDQAYNISRIQLVFGNKYHYFKILVSSDHKEYKEIATVTADNYTEYYTNYVCTIDGLDLEKVQYVKILFTGTSSGSAFVNLYEAEFFGVIPTKENIEDQEM